MALHCIIKVFFVVSVSIVCSTLTNQLVRASSYGHPRFNSSDQLLVYSTGSCFKLYRLDPIDGVDRHLGEVLLPLNGSISCHDEDRSSISAFDYFHDRTTDQLNLVWINSNDASVRSAQLDLPSSWSLPHDASTDINPTRTSISNRPSLINGRILFQFNISDDSPQFWSRGLAIDAKSQRLYVSLDGSQSMHVIDLQTGFYDRSIETNATSSSSQLKFDCDRNRLYWLQKLTSVWTLDLNTDSVKMVFNSSQTITFTIEQSTGNGFILNEKGNLMELILDDRNISSLPSSTRSIQTLDFQSRKISRPFRLLMSSEATDFSSHTRTRFLFSDLDQRRSRLYQFPSGKLDKVSTIRPDLLFMDSKITDVHLVSFKSVLPITTSPPPSVTMVGFSLPLVVTTFLQFRIVIGFLIFLAVTCLVMWNKSWRLLNPRSALRCRFLLCSSAPQDKRLLASRNSDLI